MEKHWLKKESSRVVLVIALGWAAGPDAVKNIKAPGYNILCLYDYRDIGMDTLRQYESEIGNEISGYQVRILWAWSFGVLMSELLLVGIPFGRSVAFNGTPYPVHKSFGIDPRRMEVTIRGIRAGGMNDFDRRAYGKYYESAACGLNPRGLAANIEELVNLRDLSLSGINRNISWSHAVIGSEDSIFPPENMAGYWGDRAKILPLPHYPFGEPDITAKYLGYR